MSSKLRITFFFVLFMSILVGIGEAERRFITYNPTSSQPIGYYLLLPISNIKKGEVYTANMPKHSEQIISALGFKLASHVILKKITGVPGDTITVSSKGVLINNKLIPDSIAEQYSRGISLDPVPIGYTHKLQQNEYWVSGNSTHSFDSRYFGYLTREEFRNHAIFLF